MRVLPGKPIELVRRTDELKNGQIFTGILDGGSGDIHTFYALRDESKRQTRLITLDANHDCGVFDDVQPANIQVFRPYIGILRVTPEPDGSEAQ